MRAPDVARSRRRSRGEEIASSLSHGITLLATLAALPVLVVFAFHDGGAARIVGASVFGVALVLLYLSSTLCHALPNGRARRVFYVLDHSTIHVFIAGTGTPFTLGALAGCRGWTLFVLTGSACRFVAVLRYAG